MVVMVVACQDGLMVLWLIMSKIERRHAILNGNVLQRLNGMSCNA
jgi:hypothetical protein